MRLHFLTTGMTMQALTDAHDALTFTHLNHSRKRNLMRALVIASVTVCEKRICGEYKYSRTLVARTLVARLPWLFRIRS